MPDRLGGSTRWARRFTPLAVVALVVAAGARAASPPVESLFTDGVRPLTAEQYRHTIADIFGEDIQIPGVAASPERFEQSDWMAQGIAAQVVDPAHRVALVGCTPRDAAQPDNECAATFVRRTGFLLFRRPLAAADLARYVGAADEGARITKDFYAGLALSLASMLTSPAFLFDIDSLERDPAKAGTHRLDAYSRASRLSLFLWQTAPDPRLLDAAARGELHTSAGLAKQVDRLVTSPRLAAGALAARFGREGEPLRAWLRETVTSPAFFTVSPASQARLAGAVR